MNFSDKPFTVNNVKLYCYYCKKFKDEINITYSKNGYRYITHCQKHIITKTILNALNNEDSN
jgi:hypothetical protein